MLVERRNVRIELGEVHIRRDQPMLDSEQCFQHSSKPRTAFEMANDCLYGPDVKR
jgi:hypothetical protein